MSINKIIDECIERGIVLKLVRNELDVKAPKGAFNSELINTIRENKEEIVEWLKQGELQDNKKKNSVTKAPEISKNPLSSNQLRLWLFEQCNHGSTAYNIRSQLEIAGELDFGALNNAINRVVERHQVLRSIYQSVEGEPYQETLSCYNVPFICHDISGEAELEREAAHKLLIDASLNYKFDLSKDVLFRAELIKFEEDKYTLLMLTHHIAADAWSIDIIIKEIVYYYINFINDGGGQLPELNIQYKDYAYWQNECLSGKPLDKMFDFWKHYLEGSSTVCNLPIDHKRPNLQRHQGACFQQNVAASMLNTMKSFVVETQSSLFMFMQAAYGILLARYSGCSDILVGFPIVNRDEKSLEPLVGYFSNTLVLRTQLSEPVTMIELLSRTKKEFTEIFSNQKIPFEYLVDKLVYGRNGNKQSLFQHSIIMQGKSEQSTIISVPGLKINVQEPSSRNAKCDLSLYIIEEDLGLRLEWEYDVDLFDCSTIERMARNYQYFLEQLMLSPNTEVLKVPIINPAEREYLASTLNDTHSLYNRKKLVHQLFEDQAVKFPNNIAIFSDVCRLSYKEVNQRANQLAHLLQDQGVGSEHLVGIALERGVDFFIWILAILKAGAAYLPIDISYPEKRIRYILADSGVELIITESSVLQSLPIKEHRILLSEDYLGAEVINQYSKQNINSKTIKLVPSNLAYVIYTSGSTGKPKGVLIEHKGMMNLAYSQSIAFGLSADSIVLQFASVSFDAATSEWLMALTNGASLYICDKLNHHSPEALSNCLIAHCITHLTLPPSILDLLNSEKKYFFEALIVAGESPSAQLVNTWSGKYKMFNAYGPTEATVCASIGSMSPDSSVNIGKALTNTKIYILDPEQKLSPKGAIGELYIGGVGIARGYLNREQLTLERFIDNPFVTGEKLYRSGDLVRYQYDDNVEFIGRVDNQVKFNGLRIELEEIEYQLQKIDDIKNAVVLTLGEAGELKRLVAYVQLEDNSTKNYREKTLRFKKELAGQLPHYMVPSAFKIISEWPLTNNGKVDRLTLSTFESAIVQCDYVAPENKTEKVLVKLFSDILKTPAIQLSVLSNFFEVGGNSLLMIKLIARVNNEFKLNISTASIINDLTVTDMANVIDGLICYQEVEKSWGGASFINEGCF